MPDEHKAPKLRPVRAWLYDMTSPQWSLLRWCLVLLLILGRVADGDPFTIRSWLGVLAVSAVLMLPNIASIAFAGMRLDLSHTQEQLGEVRRQVQHLQVQVAAAATSRSSSHTFLGYSPDQVRDIVGGGSDVAKPSGTESLLDLLANLDKQLPGEDVSS